MARTSPRAPGGDGLDRLQAELSRIGNRAADLSGVSFLLFLLLPVDLPEGWSPAGHRGLAPVLEAVSDAARRRHVVLVAPGFARAGPQPCAADSLAAQDCQGARQECLDRASAARAGHQ